MFVKIIKWLRNKDELLLYFKIKKEKRNMKPKEKN